MTQLKRLIPILLIAFLQLIMTQIVTFIFSFLFPGGGETLQSRPWVFALFLGCTFTSGVFSTGWLAISLGWLKMPPRSMGRLAGALVGAFVPLLAGAAIVGRLEAGSPLFLISILASIAGFYLPGGRT